MIQSRGVAILITVLVLLSMSLGTVLTKMVFSVVSPAAFLYLSLLVGMAAMSLYTFVVKKERIPHELMTKKIWSYVIQIAFFNFVTGTLGFFSLKYLPATTNTYLTNFIGFMTMGMSMFILKEMPGFYQVFGAAIAFAGLRIFFPEPPKGGELIGVIMILISITGVAYTNNIARKLALETENKISNNIISTLAILIGGSVAAVIYLIVDGWPPYVPRWTDWAIILYSGIVMRAMGLTIWNLILRTLRSYEASILGASTVIWTSILAVIILDEVLTRNQIIGIVMMLAGLILVQVRRSLRNKPKPPATIPTH
ncbi:MAG: DMT family transporter [Anaerolineales bacterium]|nr:DMT family transporter [Anaerolineales bacterium]